MCTSISSVTVPEFKKKLTVIIFKSYYLYLKPFYAIAKLYSTLLKLLREL